MSWLKTTTHNGNGSLVKTIAGKFKRLKFFHGMLLTENDFLEEQTYFREKIKLHNRLHGYGVVWGLCLKRHIEVRHECATDTEEGGTPVPMVTIEAGFALDCNGNEILVCTDYAVSLEKAIKALERQGKVGGCEPEKRSKLYIGVRYCECCAEPAEQYTSTCDDELHPQYSRIREGFCPVVIPEDEMPACSDHPGSVVDDCHCLKPGYQCPGAGGCADEHTIILGWVSIEGDETQRRYISEDKIHQNVKGVSPLAYQKWDEARRKVLQAACCLQPKWHDLTFVIGKPYENVKTTLEGLKFPVARREISKLTLSDLARVGAAQPCFQARTPVQLITDDGPADKACVLFVVALPVLLPEEYPVPVEAEFYEEYQEDPDSMPEPDYEGPFQKVYFDRNSSELTDEARQILEENVKMLCHYSDVGVSVVGYASRDERSMQRLSTERAHVVEQYYVEHISDAGNLNVEGRGGLGDKADPEPEKYRYVETNLD